MIREATVGDIAGWINLAREVEHLFGPMADCPEFEKGLKRCASEGHAFVSESEKGSIEGAIAIDREANEIAWLAVGRSARGQGVGSALLQRALFALDASRPMRVQTFAEGIEEGEGARRLFSAFGFCEASRAGKNPAGIDTVMMIRPARRSAEFGKND